MSTVTRLVKHLTLATKVKVGLGKSMSRNHIVYNISYERAFRELYHMLFIHLEWSSQSALVSNKTHFSCI